MAPQNLDRLVQVYGPTTWDVYDQLDVSLNPEGPDSLFRDAERLILPGSVVLDAGCRDGAQLIELVNRLGVTGVGIEPVPIHAARAQDGVAAAGLSGQITIHQATMQDIALTDDHVDFVWCREVLVQVDDLAGGLDEVVRVMKPGAAMLVYTSVVTDRLSADERQSLLHHRGNVAENLDRSTIESAFAGAQLAVESVREIGTEWREYAEERTQPVSQSLLRLARLRRQEDDIVAEHGREIFDHVEANLHWELYQFLGKLTSLVYVLRAPGAA